MKSIMDKFGLSQKDIIYTKNWLSLIFKNNHVNKSKQELKIINFDSI